MTPVKFIQRIRYITVFVILLALAWPGMAFAKSNLPLKARIRGVNGHAQKYSLSCESRSAVDWAAYWGVDISEKKFLKNLPRSENPEKGFVGQPGDPIGQIPPASYGVHAGPVAALLRAYGLDAQAVREMDWEQAQAEIAADRPLIVWVIGEMWPGKPVEFTSADGETSTVAAFEHTMILVGYSSNSVYVIDPTTGHEQAYPLRSFINSWNVLGRMAVVGGGELLPAPTPEPDVDPLLTPTVEPAPETEIDALPVDNELGPQETPPGTESQTPAKIYIVRRGDSLTRIAKQLGVNWRTLARLNNLSAPYIIFSGQRLRLP